MNYRQRFQILERDGFACRYCGQKAPSVVLHVDHVKARANGGDDSPSNLVTACSACNHGKSASDLPIDVGFADALSLYGGLIHCWMNAFGSATLGSVPEMAPTLELLEKHGRGILLAPHYARQRCDEDPTLAPMEAFRLAIEDFIAQAADGTGPLSAAARMD